jgi:transposase-like protein
MEVKPFRDPSFRRHCHVAKLVEYDRVMKNAKWLYHGHRFPAAVIICAVRWYFRFQLSLRDIEELLFERGIIVSYETVRRWCDEWCVFRTPCESRASQAWHHLAS